MPTVIKRGKVKIWYDNTFTRGQKRLAKRHGTPSEFAAACYAACPEFISMTEARTAVDRYQREWDSA